MFTLFDLDHDGVLAKKEFIDGCCKLFNSDFDENLKLVFSICDFDSDGWINKEDIRTVLSSLPLSSMNPGQSMGVRKEGMYTKMGGGQ